MARVQLNWIELDDVSALSAPVSVLPGRGRYTTYRDGFMSEHCPCAQLVDCITQTHIFSLSHHDGSE